MTVEALKDRARRHEQKDEWQAALDLYRQAVSWQTEEEQVDVGLWNRIGDIQTRLGNVGAAVEAYEKAVDLYVESELPNNAIAVCKKIVRHMPLRNEVYLRMGKIRVDQGFLVDARQNFLTYAERMQARGELDEAFRALIEFADLAPEDTDLRLAIAAQLEQQERTDEAIEQLKIGYVSLVAAGRDDGLADFAERLADLDPQLDLDELSEAAASGAASTSFEAAQEEAYTGEPVGDGLATGFESDRVEGFETTSIPGSPLSSESGRVGGAVGLASEPDDEEEDLEPLPLLATEDGRPVRATDDPEEEGHEEGGADVSEGASEDAGSGGEASVAEETGGKEASQTGDPAEAFQDAVEEAAAEEPEEAVDLALDDSAEPATEEAPGGTSAVEEMAVDPDEAVAEVQARIAAEPDDVSHRQRFVELAFRARDQELLATAYLGLAECMERAGEEEKARAVFQQVLTLDPDNAEAARALSQGGGGPEPVREVASSEDYVDLGALILDDDDEKSTRFVVAYEEPSGDEEADFAKMLTQFKQKVSENLAVDDVRAHHDLGTAYKEMGLLDEAIEEFQVALRTSAGHLPTYELLGQCFMEKGEYDAAVRSLSRALEAPGTVEDELVGILYYLGRAHEELGNTGSAVEFYDRVFSLDINFADVTERLRALR